MANFKKVKALFEFEEGQLIPKELLRFYHEGELVDVGAVTKACGLVIVCECGFIVFVSEGNHENKAINITNRENEGFAANGHAESLYLSTSIKAAEVDYDIESVSGSGFSFRQMKDFNNEFSVLK